jgi:hypothetical protein
MAYKEHDDDRERDVGKTIALVIAILATVFVIGMVMKNVVVHFGKKL